MLKPPPGGKLTICCPQAGKSQTGWNQKVHDLTPTFSPPANQKNVYEQTMPCSLSTHKTHYPSRWGHNLEVLATVAPFAWKSNKAISFYFTQNRCQELIWLQGTKFQQQCIFHSRFMKQFNSQVFASVHPFHHSWTQQSPLSRVCHSCCCC